jgi:methanol metabolism-related c-type cytochrome
LFRVCADPRSLPFSNEAHQGFEDKLAELFAEKLGKTVSYTYYPRTIGFVRYSANCMHCHGPDGLGSTYAPSLVNSLKTLGYTDVMTVVASGRKNVSESSQLVMPALGEDKNVMCFIDAIYIYLRARSDGAIGRGRPAEHEPKPKGFSAAEDSCMG